MRFGIVFRAMACVAIVGWEALPGPRRRSAAIPEYWVVDLKEDVVHVFRNPRGEVYLERLTAKPGEVISPAEYPDVAIDVALVLGDL